MHANASRSGTLKVGGDIATNRLGFGAMRLTGEGIWGEPADRTECLRQQAMMSQRFLEVEQVGL